MAQVSRPRGRGGPRRIGLRQTIDPQGGQQLRWREQRQPPRGRGRVEAGHEARHST